MKHIRLFEELINEIGDASHKPFKWKLSKPYSGYYYNTPQEFLKAVNKGIDDGLTMYQFTTDKGTQYEVEIEFQLYPSEDPFQLQVEINFWTSNKGDRNKEMELTNKHELFSVMATVTDICLHWVNLWDKHFYMKGIHIEPKREEDDYGIDPTDSRRGRIYLQYIRKQLSRLKNPHGKYKVDVYNDYFKIEPRWYPEEQ